MRVFFENLVITMSDTESSLPVVYAKALGYIFVLPLIIYLISNFSFIKDFLSPYSNTIGILSIAYIVVSSFFVIYLYLAPRAVCFIFAQENIATLIQCGGSFDGLVYRSRDLEIDENCEVLERKSKKNIGWIKSFLRNTIGGLTFYGITPVKDVLFIDLKHNKLIEREKEDTREIEYRVHKTEKRTSRIDLKITNYSMFFGEMETKDRNQVYAIMTATLRVSNVYTFLKNRDPYGRLEETLWGAFRNFIREFNTDQVIGSSEEDEGQKKATETQKGMLGKQFFDFLMSPQGKMNIAIELMNNRMKIQDLGFEIINFSILDINLKDRSAEEASKMLYIATKKKKAAIIEAEGEAEKIKTVARAEAEKISLIAEVCQRFDIPPKLQLLIEKMGPDQANYYYWHGGFHQDFSDVGQKVEENFKKVLTQLNSSEKKQP